MTVYRALKDNKYRPYRPRLVHGLLEDDPFQRIEFAERFRNMADDDETLLDRVPVRLQKCMDADGLQTELF